MTRTVAHRVAPRATLLVSGLAVLMACAPEVERGDAVFIPETPHERYEFSLRQAGLETTLLGYKWIDAGLTALDEALSVRAPHHEVGYFDPNDAPSLGYRMTLRRGQRLVIEVDVRSDSAQVFMDLFRVRGDTMRPYIHETHADSGVTALDYVVPRDGDYVLRLQPELLADQQYEVMIINTASLAFPVAGHGPPNIRSAFGAAREGGRREHHGVDIFAPRGTPALAAHDGVVRSTRGNRLGGRVVWLRTALGSLYYAHLDSVAVRRNDSVRAGDTVGFVGNTGNARSTPPHLHFGIYARRPTDPFPYLFEPSTLAPRLTADGELLRSVVRTTATMAVRQSPSGRARELVRIDDGTAMLVLGGTGSWYRVRLPDRTTGFVAADAVEIIHNPWRLDVVASATPLYRQPAANDFVLDSLDAGLDVPILGRFGDFYYVEGPGGVSGWVPAEFVRRTADRAAGIVADLQ